MKTHDPTLGFIPYPIGVLRWFLRSPLWLYRLGLGWLIGWIPLMVLTTRGRNSGAPRHAIVEWRRHGKKIYIVSGWGKRPNWYQNLTVYPLVTLQQGGRILRARATTVTDHDEAARALYMFRKNSPIYEVILTSMSSAEQIDFNTLPDVSGEFTVIRFDIEAGEPELPVIPQLAGWMLPFGVGALMLGVLFRAWRAQGDNV